MPSSSADRILTRLDSMDDYAGTPTGVEPSVMWRDPATGLWAPKPQSGLSVIPPVRKRYLEMPKAPSEHFVYLWHCQGTAAGQVHYNEKWLLAPAGGMYWALFRFQLLAGQPSYYLTGISQAVPALCIDAANAAVVKVGTWSTIANTESFNGQYVRSLIAGDTMTGTTTGPISVIRGVQISNGGFATVSIDGDFTRANRLPKVTQALINLGYFTQGQLGQAYLDTYAGLSDFDAHWCIADNLSSGDHTVQIRVQGTKYAASSDVRVYITAFCGADPSNRIGDSNVYFVQTRHVGFLFNGLSSIVSVTSYAPNSAPTNYQFMDEGHGNAAFVTDDWRVDGAVVGTAPNTIYKGRSATYWRHNKLNHPSAADCARRFVTHTVTAGRPFQLYNNIQIMWQTPGIVVDGYAAMCPLCELAPPGGLLYVNKSWDKVRLDDYLLTLPQLNDGAFNGQQKAQTAFFHSVNHDTVAMVHVPDVHAGLNDDQNVTTIWASVQDRAGDGMDKYYRTRTQLTAPLNVVNGTVEVWDNAYAVFNIKNAAAVLAAA